MAVLTKDMVAGLVSTGASARVDADVAASFKVGDRVVFSAYAGTETTIDGDELVIMTESDIMGIIE